MENSIDLSYIFEPELIKEIESSGEIKRFHEGDLIMDYGKYIRMMPLILKGTIKVLRMDESGKEILLYYLSSTESCSMAYSCCMEAKKSEVKAIAEDLQVNLGKINHHGGRASSIVKGMLEHSRASTGVKEPTDLNALADEYLRLAYHGLRAKDNNFNATMETHFDPDLPKVSVIPQDIGRVMLNLINNAFYAVAERKPW